MNDKTILVIDDSATIRKLVDTHLSPSGYRVVLAPNAEEGLRLAMEVQPDLILLDHQLPGTTGYDVCCQLVQTPQLKQIPVVISSTLRKKAYAEYIDLDNVVDMLPKPYTEDLLRTTVANALETAAMIVNSQSQGTAVPEVIQQLGEAALAGSFAFFGLRELLDFLNNGRKSGVLEVEAEQTRIRFHLDKGRIQGVSASGLDAEVIDDLTRRLPASLVNLAPVMKMTIGGRSCAEVDGFVQLLDQKVLDPRLMTKLLRYQAASLVQIAFTKKLSGFRFDDGASGHSLHKNLPLDISLLALLVEGAMHISDSAPSPVEHCSYARHAIRGQNLDRAGLSARHMKVLNALAEPKNTLELAEILGWDADEVQQVMSGFVMAELVEQRTHHVAGEFVIYEPNATAAQAIRTSLEESDNRYAGKVVRDQLALQLVLKRSVPHTIVFCGEDSQSCQMIKQLFATAHPKAAQVRRIALVGEGAPAHAIDWTDRIGFKPDEMIVRPYTADSLFAAMVRVLAGRKSVDAARDAAASPRTETNDRPARMPYTADLSSQAAVGEGVAS
ncbi:MAG: response regulator [Planctomycetaceae bacterium]